MQSLVQLFTTAKSPAPTNYIFPNKCNFSTVLFSKPVDIYTLVGRNQGFCLSTSVMSNRRAKRGKKKTHIAFCIAAGKH